MGGKNDSGGETEEHKMWPHKQNREFPDFVVDEDESTPKYKEEKYVNKNWWDITENTCWVLSLSVVLLACGSTFIFASYQSWGRQCHLPLSFILMGIATCLLLPPVFHIVVGTCLWKEPGVEPRLFLSWLTLLLLLALGYF